MSAEQPERPTVFVTADRLAAAMEKMTSALEVADKASKERDEANVRYGRRNRLYIILDVLLTVISTVAVGVAVHAVGNSDAAKAHAAAAAARAAVARQSVTAIHINQVAACRIGNELRNQQRAAIDGILTLGKIPASTPPAQRRAELAVRRTAVTLVGHAWGDLNCAKLYRLAGTGPSLSAPPGGTR